MPCLGNMLSLMAILKYIHLLIINIDLKYLTLTELKSRYDEEKSLKEAGDQRVAKLNEQLQREKEENERLQTELVQHTIHSCWRLFSRPAALRPTLYIVKAALSQLPCFENRMNNFEVSPWNLVSTEMLGRRITLRQSLENRLWAKILPTMLKLVYSEYYILYRTLPCPHM